MLINKILISSIMNIVMFIFSFIAGVIITRALDISSRGEVAEYFLILNLIIPFSLFAIYDNVISSRKKSKVYLSYIIINYSIPLLFTLLFITAFAIIKNINYLVTLNIILILISNYIIIGYLAALSLTSCINKISYIKTIVPMSYASMVFFGYIFDLVSFSSIILFNCISNIICLIVVVVYAKKENFKVTKINFSHFIKLFKKVKWLGLSALVVAFASKIEQITIVTVLGYEELAFYVVAISATIVIINFYVNSIITVLYPRFSRVPSRKVMLVKSFQILFISFLLIVLISIMLYFLYPYLIPFVFGDKYTESSDIARLLIFGGCAFYVKIYAGKVFKLIGNNRVVFILDLISPVLFLIFSLGLIYVSDKNLTLLNIVSLSVITQVFSALIFILFYFYKMISLKVKIEDFSLVKLKGFFYE